MDSATSIDRLYTGLTAGLSIPLYGFITLSPTLNSNTKLEKAFNSIVWIHAAMAAKALESFPDLSIPLYGFVQPRGCAEGG